MCILGRGDKEASEAMNDILAQVRGRGPEGGCERGTGSEIHVNV